MVPWHWRLPGPRVWFGVHGGLGCIALTTPKLHCSPDAQRCLQQDGQVPVVLQWRMFRDCFENTPATTHVGSLFQYGSGLRLT